MGILTVKTLSRHSHVIVDVECDLKCSSDCSKIYKISYRSAMDNMERNNGVLNCFTCSRKSKFTGRTNPNCKHEFDDNALHSIDSDEKAYLLGWIASDGSVRKDGFTIAIHLKDEYILDSLRKLISDDIIIKRKNDTIRYITVNSTIMANDVCTHLQINPGKKDDVVRMPNLSDQKLTWAFIRGYFDGDGCVNEPRADAIPSADITSNSLGMLRDIGEFTGISYSLSETNGRLYFYGVNALDFLSKMYDGDFLKLRRKYSRYIDWTCWSSPLKYQGVEKNHVRFPHCLVAKTDSNAILPSKARFSDIGYDLTIIKPVGPFGSATLYDSCIKLQPEIGWYGEVVPRSSLSKSGYMLANSMGIIDMAYTGTIKVALVKVDPTAPDIQLPFRGFQIIFRKATHFEIVEVDEEDFISTERGDKGFGSSDKRMKLE